jgi:crotonobetainyl-CoA:carnitine CoA-transferase CaiB-like acyl-CoA transferase
LTASPSSGRDAGRPLVGLRVLEVATLYAAPQIGAMLGDLGADVVKVEPPSGDPMRRMGRTTSWDLVARGKRSVVLDLEPGADGAAPDAELFAGLVLAADVLVENLSPDVRARWECTYEALSAHNPRLVVVSVSCYGLTGPYADRPGAGTLAEAFGGLTHMIGEADGPPMLASVAIGDTVTAFSGVIGALAACWSRDARGGSGSHVDVSMYEPILAIMAGTIAGWDGDGEPPRRSGSRVHGGVPRNVYRTLDDAYVALSGTTDSQVARVLAVIGRDGDADRARFGTAAARLQVSDELDGLVADWIRAHPRDAVLEAFVAARVPVSPVNDAGDLLEDPHIAARGGIPSAPPGPSLGEHREVVLADWLGGSG